MDKFIKNFESKVKNTIKKFNLLDKKDKVLVACSGGKDSTVVLYILKKLNYNVEAITIDTGLGKYTQLNLKNLRDFCKQYKIKLHELSFRKEFGYTTCYIRSVLASKGIKLNSCYICGILRRQLINKAARKLKKTKLVTGHNLDDEVQVIMMNLLRGNPSLSARLGPTTGVIKDKRFIPRIKPLYLCLEKEVAQYSRLMNFNIQYTKCPCRSTSSRLAIIDFLNSFDDKTKYNVINHFLKQLPKLKEKYKTNKNPNYCRICKEPCSLDICKACWIKENLKK